MTPTCIVVEFFKFSNLLNRNLGVKGRIKKHTIVYETYFTTYGHTYQIYIKIGRVISEECDHKHRGTRFIYISTFKQGVVVDFGGYDRR